MIGILKTEINRLIDILLQINNHTSFDAYIEKMQEFDNLPYFELKYYLEQIQNIIKEYNEDNYWKEELSTVKKCLDILEKTEVDRISFLREFEPIKKFWNSFKLWTKNDLPALKILKPYYVEYDNWDGGTYYLNIDMSMEFTKAYGLDYNERFEKDIISIDDLKMYIELFYGQFVENRYEYTKFVNKAFSRFFLPYQLKGGKIIKKGYKTSEVNPPIIDYPMLESKILWAENRILGKEKLDKHTALNYITDSLQYIISLIKDNCPEGRELDQKCANLVGEEGSKVYSVIKNEVNEIQKIVNEYFDIRHNEYINKSKKIREPIEDSLFIEYLYNRIYSLLFILKTNYSKFENKKVEETDVMDLNDLPF